ncbi:hypothetical protein C0991_001603, partial [Blastosporella zonata]
MVRVVVKGSPRLEDEGLNCTEGREMASPPEDELTRETRLAEEADIEEEKRMRAELAARVTAQAPTRPHPSAISETVAEPTANPEPSAAMTGADAPADANEKAQPAAAGNAATA